jgi:DNA primase
MFADNFVEELKDRIDLYDLISPYVQLKKSGSKWVGLSPFNQEKTPSFYVDSDRGFFHCFSSGEKGDALSFVQKVENLTFPEAIEFLANRFGIPIRYSEKSGGKANTYRKSIKSDLYAVQETAMSWFTEQLHSDSKDSRIALDYWIKERKFSLDDAKKFGIGYAPVDRFALAHYLQKKGISEVILSKSGLFNEKKQSGQFASRFCGRLMIPIREKIGRVCGFTARQLAMTPSWGDRKSPKYVNSPETPIFLKSDLLFNLYLANKEINETREFILVEGQLDAIRCWVEGFKTVVAPQGTAFTDSQAMLLRKSNPKGVVCLLDGDQAGQKAAFSYIPTFLRVGLDARFTTLPEGKDPDQILVEEGTEGMQNILDKGMTAIEYAVHFKLKGKKNPQASEIRAVSELVFSSISEVDSLIMRDSYLKELSRNLKVSFQTMNEEFNHFKRAKKPKYKTGKDKKEEISRKKASPRLTTAEDDLLFCLLHDNRVASPLAQIFDPTWLNLDIPAGRILAKIMAETKADGPIEPNRMEEFLEDDSERNVFQQNFFQEVSSFDENSFLQHANECLLALFIRSIKQKEKRILTDLENSSDQSDLLSTLRSELLELRKNRKNPPQLIFSDQHTRYSHA